MQTAVGEAGFELLWSELSLHGTLSRAVDRDGHELMALTVAATGQRFLLHRGETDEEREAYARLSEWLDTPPRSMSLRGRAHTHTGDDPALAVHEFRVDP